MIVNRRGVSAIVATVAAGTVLACATIMHGTGQDIAISSQPTGARVTVDQMAHGVTPVSVDLKRKDHHTIRIELAGYMPYEITTTRGVSGWVWGNIIFGGLIGLAVDAISGGMYKISPEEVQAALQRNSASATFEENTLYVILVPSIDPAWEKIGQLEDFDAYR